MASTSNIGKKLEIDKTVNVLTIHNMMGERVSFNNQNYSWIICAAFVEVARKDGKWHAYFPTANVVKAEVEETKWHVKELRK